MDNELRRRAHNIHALTNGVPIRILEMFFTEKFGENTISRRTIIEHLNEVGAPAIDSNLRVMKNAKVIMRTGVLNDKEAYYIVHPEIEDWLYTVLSAIFEQEIADNSR